jgi:hypothetical protein
MTTPTVHETAITQEGSRIMTRRDRIGLRVLLALWPIHLTAWTYCAGTVLIPQ